MFHDSAHEEEEPASVQVKTESGGIYDIKNIPGTVKTKLIMEGEMSSNDFTTPDNMPGKKLKKLRDEANKGVEEGIKSQTKTAKPMNYKLGDVVRFKNLVSAIIGIEEARGMLRLTKADGKPSKWIHYTKVELVEPEE